MHQGHLDVIMRAKKENDACFVVVCGYDNEPRANEIGLDIEQRYALVKKLFKGDEQIIVLSQNDTELGLDESMSDNNWKIWLGAINNKMREHCVIDANTPPKVTFYVAEAKYVEPIKRCFPKYIKPDVELVDKLNYVSGTMIRKNPLMWWNKIALTFRPYFSHNIFILGTASEGKSTLVRDLSTYFNLPYVEEHGRTGMARDSKCDNALRVNDYVKFLMKQSSLLRETIGSRSNPGIVLSDTDNLVTLMYAKAYVDDPKIPVSKDDYDNVILPLAKSLKQYVKYSKIFLLPPKNAFVDDGIRYMEQSSIEDRKNNYEILCDLIREFGFQEDMVTVLNGNYYENFLTVKNYILDLSVDQPFHPAMA